MKDIKSNPFFLHINEPIDKVGEGISRQIIAYDNNIMMVKVLFEKGAIGVWHSHSHTQTTYVVSGRFKVKIGKEEKILDAGDGFYAEPNIGHECICLESGSLIDVFNPVREDFL